MANKTKSKEKTKITVQEEKAPQEQKKKPARSFTAIDKSKAVLSLWGERRKVMEICTELSIPWNLLNHWQNRAMEGMLQALEPRMQLEKGPALSPRLQAMLEKRSIPVPLEQARETRKESSPTHKKS